MLATAAVAPLRQVERAHLGNRVMNILSRRALVGEAQALHAGKSFAGTRGICAHDALLPDNPMVALMGQRPVRLERDRHGEAHDGLLEAGDEDVETII